MSLFQTSNSRRITTDTLVKDLRTLTRDAEELAKVTGNNLSEKAKETMTETLSQLKNSCRDLEEKAVTGARATDEMIRDNPYWTAGAAFGMGVLIGVLIYRQARD